MKVDGGAAGAVADDAQAQLEGVGGVRVVVKVAEVVERDYRV